MQSNEYVGEQFGVGLVDVEKFPVVAKIYKVSLAPVGSAFSCFRRSKSFQKSNYSETPSLVITEVFGMQIL